MSLLNRRPVRIGRAQRDLRDDRIFVVASDDAYAPKQYLEGLSFPRIKFVPLPTIPGEASAPYHVVQRLKEAFDGFHERGEIQNGDEFWVLLDTDHYITGSHIKDTLAALQSAGHKGFNVAMSNPCFELWLLLHHLDVAPGTVFTDCDAVAQRLRGLVDGYNKTNIRAERFSQHLIPKAIARARSLESHPDAPEGYWPGTTGTRIYVLMERVFAKTQ